MKILIGSLLFATAIVFNFPEFNSSPQPSSGAGPSHRNVDLQNLQRERRVPKHKCITLFGQQIEVDIEWIRNSFEAVGCRVINPIYRIPTRRIKRTTNFMTQADFIRVETNILRIVIYVHEDDQKIRRLLGAKLPPTGNEGYHPGDPKRLNPDHTKWFITYDGVDYEVEVDHISQNYVDITLYGRENLRPSHDTIIEMWYFYPYIHFGGVYFLVFKDSNNKVQGAAIDPFWKYRPGEEFQHQNPHDHRQTHPQINHPIVSDPVTQQNLEQQHYLGQQQNFDPYQNLYQNPYPCPHQTPDLNQDYVQQGGFQTPRPRSNQNWHYPPHRPSTP